MKKVLKRTSSIFHGDSILMLLEIGEMCVNKYLCICIYIYNVIVHIFITSQRRFTLVNFRIKFKYISNFFYFPSTVIHFCLHERILIIIFLYESTGLKFFLNINYCFLILKYYGNHYPTVYLL